MVKLKAFFLLCAVAVLTLTACNKDSASPIFDEFKVNAAATTALAGNHNLGDVVNFEVSVSDDSSLGFYEISQQESEVVSNLLVEGTLDGNTDTFTFSFDIDSNTYVVGENIILVFLVQDARGLSTVRNYTMNVN